MWDSVSTKFLEMVDAGIMPPPIDVDGSPRWDRLELDSAVDNLKDRRRDPVTRDRERLQERLRTMEGNVNEGKLAVRGRAA